MYSKQTSFALQITILSFNLIAIIATKYSTGLNTIVSGNSDYGTAHLSITIDSITDEVEILMIREISATDDVSQHWFGIGFSSDDSYSSGHSNIYSIIANADGSFGEASSLNNRNMVQEYTLSKRSRGTMYAIPEITVVSDIYSQNGRNVKITRPRSGTFNFPLFPGQLDANDEYKIAVIAAFGLGGDYSSYVHGRDSYSRDTKTLTFAALSDSTSTTSAISTTTITTTTAHVPTAASTTTTTTAPKTTTTTIKSVLNTNPTTNSPAYSGYNDQSTDISTDIPADSTTQSSNIPKPETTHPDVKMEINDDELFIKNTDELIIALVIGAFVLIMVVVCIIWLMIKKNRKDRKYNDEDDIISIMDESGENKKVKNKKVKNKKGYHSVDATIDVLFEQTENEQEGLNKV